MNEMLTSQAAEVIALSPEDVKRRYPRFEDLTGKKFGRLTCVAYLGFKKWLCECECGARKAIHKKHLRSGNTVSCRCHRKSIGHEVAMLGAPKRVKNLAGRRFGRLVVLARIMNQKYTTWECLCDCGKVHRVNYGALVMGRTRSCGCLAREGASRRARNRPRVPEERKRLRRIWYAMLGRCFNPDAAGYHRYGGRGITACAAWRESFDAFARDMGYAPSLDHSLERIDNDGNYCPENCKWATPKEQCRNRYDNLSATMNGVTKLLVEWAEIYPVTAGLIGGRIKRGWSAEAAITTPPQTSGYHIRKASAGK